MEYLPHHTLVPREVILLNHCNSDLLGGMYYIAIPCPNDRVLILVPFDDK